MKDWFFSAHMLLVQLWEVRLQHFITFKAIWYKAILKSWCEIPVKYYKTPPIRRRGIKRLKVHENNAKANPGFQHTR
jgi:hypothetical protein